MARADENMKTEGDRLDSSDIGIIKTILAGVPCRSNRGWFGYCTIVLLSLDGGWALFDTGHYNDRTLLREALSRRGIEPDDIRHVILSHLHFDHVLNLPLFQNAEIILCEAEISYAEEVGAGLLQDDAIPDFWPALLEGRKVHTVKDALMIANRLEIVRLPGHTPGCLSLFYSDTPSVAVCGDVVKNAWEAVSGAPTTQSLDDDLSRKSIKTVRQRGEVIIPGHDCPFRLCDEGLEYLGAFSWEIYGDVFPRPQNEIIYTLEMSRGFYCRP
jgi:glyoxylase-like metal-dependent hydrolase (beta-lactamase superfamily II)